MWAGIGAGLVIFTVGFGKKVLLADRLAPVVDQLFSQATQRVLDFGEAWTAALAFSFQLFLDFSAYTEMAIGSALLFGLVLPENFRRPYLSADSGLLAPLAISLSNFLRDYLYIPLAAAGKGLRVTSSPRSSRWACAGCGTGQGGPTSPGVCGTGSG